MDDQEQTGEGAPLPAIDAATANEAAAVVLRLQGPCRVLLLGSVLDALAVPLRLAGCEVSADVEVAPADAVPGSSAPVQSVQRANADVAVVLAAGNDLSSQVLDLQIPSLLVLARGGAAVPEGWLRAAAAAGWGLHTACWVMQEAVEGHAVLALARCGARLDSPDAVRLASVFSLASSLVRAGDDVLLHAPAATDAWRIVSEQSRCGWLGVTDQAAGGHDPDQPEYVKVPSIADVDGRKVDFLLLADTPLSQWSASLLLQAGHVLRRSGRLLVETGRADIADWGSHCRQLESAGFTVDRAWMLSGGSANSPMQRAELNLAEPVESQWLCDGVLMVMAVRIEGTGYPRLPDSDVPNIVAFQRDYVDASVVRLIVAMGYRIDAAAQRRAVALQVLEQAPSYSADQGAALCVLLYDNAAMEGVHGRRILRLSSRYTEQVAVNPTALRWQVSIAFVLARRSQSEGRHEDALRWYMQVLAQDVLQFSPLLGTKTTSAALAVGWLAFARDDLPAARHAWVRCLEEARRLTRDCDWREVVGDPACPETFGLPEFAAVMDEAASAAAALRVTAEAPLRRGLVWDWANRSWRQQITRLQHDLDRGRAWQDELQRGKDWLHAQYELLTAEVTRLSADQTQLYAQHQGALAASRLAHQAAEESLQRHRRLYADLLAAYRLAHQRAEQQLGDKQQQYDDLLVTYRLSHADAKRQYTQLQQHLSERELSWEQERAEAAALIERTAQLMADKDDRYAGLLANYKLARRYSNERVAVLADRYAGAVAAYRTARHHATRELDGVRALLVQQQARADELQRQLARLGDDHDSHHEVHTRLVDAADRLGRAFGRAMGNTNERSLRDEELVREMDHLAAIIDALPMRGLLRVLFRLWRRLSGRRS